MRRRPTDLIILLCLVALCAVGYRALTPPPEIPLSERVTAEMGEGLRAYRAGQFGPAIAHFTCVIQLNPDVLNAYRYRGLSRGALGQLERAVADFDLGIARATDPLATYVFPHGVGTLYLERARVDVRAGSYDEALADAAQAQERLTGSLPYLAEICDVRACALCGNGKWEEAQADLDGLVDMGERISQEGLAGEAIGGLIGLKDYPLGCHHLGLLYRRQGQLEAARQMRALEHQASHLGPCPICDWQAHK